MSMTKSVQEGLTETLPYEELLPYEQPAYVHSYVYLFGVATIASFVLLIVTGVGSAIHIYSYGYMAGDRGFSRYFASLSLFMFSMAGIPPLAGFFSKMYVILAAIGAGLTWMAVIGVVMSVISGYYYIKIVKIMYFDEPAKPFEPMPHELKAVLAATGLFNLLFFVYPSPLVEAADAAAKSLF